MNPLSSPLLTDLYQLTMLQAYFEVGMIAQSLQTFAAQVDAAAEPSGATLPTRVSARSQAACSRRDGFDAVNEKIGGFFNVCMAARGLTGEHGVFSPPPMWST